MRASLCALILDVAVVAFASTSTRSQCASYQHNALHCDWNTAKRSLDHSTHNSSPKSLASIAKIFGATPWYNASACRSFCLAQTVLVLGDSVDVQLFHALEHATAAGHASREVHQVGGGRDVQVVTRLKPEYGGGAPILCRDNGYTSLDAGRTQTGSPVREVRCGSWRDDPERKLFGLRVDVVLLGDDGRWKRRLIQDADATASELKSRADRLRSRVRAVQAAGAQPIISAMPPTNLVWDHARRRINLQTRALAGGFKVPIVPLDRFGDSVIKTAARAADVAPAYAFVQIPQPRHWLGGICSAPLRFGPQAKKLAPTKVEDLASANWTDLPLPRASYVSYGLRPKCAGFPTVMTDGTHWSPHVFSYFGVLALREIHRLRERRGKTG